LADLSEADRLRVKVELIKPELTGASNLLLGDSRICLLYPDYLVAYHGILRATIPLFETARREALARDDAGAKMLADYLEQHIAEESGEDEWALQDLELLGVDRSAVLARVPSANVARLVGAQYYWVLHVDPVAVLGYLAALERDPTPLEFIDELVRRTGYERAAFRTLIAHAERDPDHARELDELLDSIELTNEQWELVTLSAMNSVQQLARVFDDIVQAADLRKVPPAGIEPTHATV
jgi:pyrroloquinoline quinone (PQQ) biosynthesis protein C